jgi:agmatinase/guanidinopropionase
MNPRNVELRTHEGVNWGINFACSLRPAERVLEKPACTRIEAGKLTREQPTGDPELRRGVLSANVSGMRCRVVEFPFFMQPYQGIPTFGRRPQTHDAREADVAILGVPYDGATSYRSGSRFGPRAIREQSLLLWGYNNALNVAPFEALRIIDAGDADIVPPDQQATQQAIEMEACRIGAAGAAIVALGGDHSITLPLLRAASALHGPLAVAHFDSHPDTWDAEFGAQRYSHGTVFRRAIEENLIDVSAYLQIGIRGPTAGPQDYVDARRLGAKIITLDAALERGIPEVISEVNSVVNTKSVYVSLDIDAVDPAFAPGTGTPEPGGFTSHQMIQLVRGLAGLNLVGADLVEVAPPYDHGQITAILAANLVFEILSIMALKVAKRRPDPPDSRPGNSS